MSRLKVARPEILQIEPYIPGVSKIKGIEKVIKLSSNENALGSSPKAIEALRHSAETMFRYPDGGSTELREAIGKKHKISAENILCGAGSDELIALICMGFAGPGDEVLYSEHGFLMYPISALRVGAVPVKAPEKNLTTHVDNILAAVTKRTKIVFIANPNNPTGTYISESEMNRLRKHLPENILLVIDSAYAEFATETDYEAGLKLAGSTQNTVMLRTFSKIYGLAALRLGWSYSCGEIADILNRVRGPFNVSTQAHVAGIAALADGEFTQKSIDHNTQWRAFLSNEIKKLGLEIIPSACNFVLVKFADKSDKNAASANNFLKENGIIGRVMTAYGLPDYLRFTVGLEHENQALIAALTKFLQ